MSGGLSVSIILRPGLRIAQLWQGPTMVPSPHGGESKYVQPLGPQGTRLTLERTESDKLLATVSACRESDGATSSSQPHDGQRVPSPPDYASTLGIDLVDGGLELGVEVSVRCSIPDRAVDQVSGAAGGLNQLPIGAE